MCVRVTFGFIKIMLPPWPAEVPALCVGTEEKVGACWRPLHYVSSARTGNQTTREKIPGCSITLGNSVVVFFNQTISVWVTLNLCK